MLPLKVQTRFEAQVSGAASEYKSELVLSAAQAISFRVFSEGVLMILLHFLLVIRQSILKCFLIWKGTSSSSERASSGSSTFHFSSF
jgi:hypothetical protein